MASSSKRAALEQRLISLLESYPAGIIVEESLACELRDRLGVPVSEKMWRDLLRGCGRDLAPLVEGVRQEDFSSLERTLLALWRQWRDGDRDSRTRIRRAVIQAKDHAKWVARNPKVDDGKREIKEEMALWMLTWLENPDVFEPWISLRKQRLTATAAGRSTEPR